MKKSDRYNYVRVPRSDDEGNRTYDVKGIHLTERHDYPITDQGPGIHSEDGRPRWVRSKLKRSRILPPSEGLPCTSSLKPLSFSEGYEDLTSLGQQAKTMAAKVIEKGLTPIDEYYGSPK